MVRKFIRDSGGSILKEMAYDNTCSCGGKITSETVPGYGSIGYTYTLEGWLDTTTYPGPVTIDNDYDVAGNVTDVKLNGSVITHYAYDNNYRITTLTDKVITGKDRIYSFTYHGTTALKELINYPNKTKMDYDYGTAYRISKADGLMPVTGDVLTKHEIPASGGRDAVGNILLKNISTGPVNYLYDNIYQLTTYLNPVAEQKEVLYAYDEAGNRMFSRVMQPAPPANADWNQINEVNQIVKQQVAGTFYDITYDPNGNMTSKASKGASFTWDYNNRLVGYSGGGNNVEYMYNYNDLRVFKHVVGTGRDLSTLFYYNGSQLVAEGDGSRITKVYTNDNEGVLGMTRYIYDGAALKNKQQLYYLFDDLGSVVMITNHQGLPTQYYQYDAWGNITNASNDPINGLSFVGRYGGFKDWDTGLTYFWHRWYDGELGRWISRDPIGMRGGVNLYEYAQNNSINYTDMSGLTNVPAPNIYQTQTPSPFISINNIQPALQILPSAPTNPKTTPNLCCNENALKTCLTNAWGNYKASVLVFFVATGPFEEAIVIGCAMTGPAGVAECLLGAHAVVAIIDVTSLGILTIGYLIKRGQCYENCGCK